MSLSKKSLITLILIYRKVRVILDYVYLVVFGVTIHCKHTPSCSEYTIRAITRHGTIKGTFLGVKRILTCW